MIDLITPEMIRADPALGASVHARRHHRVDERHPDLPEGRRADRARPQHLRRFAVGADVDLAGAVLEAREPVRLRRRHGARASFPSTSPSGSRAGPERQGRQGLHARRDQDRGLGAAQAERELWRHRHPEGRAAPQLEPGPEHSAPPGRHHRERGAAARESGRHVEASAGGGHEDSQSVPGLRLRPHLHRSRDDGGGQRSRAPRGERHPRRPADPGAVRCGVWHLHEPEIFAPGASSTSIRYAQGLPWDDTLVRVGLSFVALADKAIVRPWRAAPRSTRLQESRNRHCSLPHQAFVSLADREAQAGRRRPTSRREATHARRAGSSALLGDSLSPRLQGARPSRAAPRRPASAVHVRAGSQIIPDSRTRHP